MILDTVKAFLLLGSNLGNREQNLAMAGRLVAERVGEVSRRSSVYETAAWGNTAQPSFLNQMLEVATRLEPMLLLQEVLAIERDMGRVRKEKWGSRTIDIDIILYGSDIVDNGPELKIPHPAMQQRRFVMVPLMEIAPDLVHPVSGKCPQEILAEIDDELEVVRI